jgi:hypothetical protein
MGEKNIYSFKINDPLFKISLLSKGGTGGMGGKY